MTEAKAKTAKPLNFKLKQKNHNGDDPYYAGTGVYFGFNFVQVGEDLVCTLPAAEAGAIDSLVKAKKVIKLSENAFKELKAEAAE